jgi:uncharacterized protein (AIM24 family)
MLAGASITPLSLTGTGNVFIEAFGGIETVELAADETYVVDNEHVVAWSGTVDLDARRVGGLRSTLLSGEGLVMDFTGPGTVWYQTRDSTPSPRPSPRCSREPARTAAQPI